MNIFTDIIKTLSVSFGKDVGTPGAILSMLLMIFLISFYEFIVYRLVSHKTMYNKSFHISLMIIPFFIGAIVMALQSNLVITLGTIGALAILRYRTAVKDPVDMMYLLWSVFIGIACGCQLYQLCIYTSITVTLVLLLINVMSDKVFKNPYILILNSKEDKEKDINRIIRKNSQSFRIKSKDFTSKGINYVYEVETKDRMALSDQIKELGYIDKFSLIEYDNEDINRWPDRSYENPAIKLNGFKKFVTNRLHYYDSYIEELVDEFNW